MASTSSVLEIELEEELAKARSAMGDSPIPEAGDVPIIIEKGSSFTIKGLINCVGVVIQVYEAGGGMDFCAAVGGHFTTPDMYDSDKEELTAKGKTFVGQLQKLVADFDPKDFEVQFIVGRSAEGISAATREGLKAAELIKAALGFGGSIDTGDSSFKVTI